MRSFLLACVAIIVIGFAASQVTERIGWSSSDQAISPTVRLD